MQQSNHTDPSNICQIHAKLNEILERGILSNTKMFNDELRYETNCLKGSMLTYIMKLIVFNVYVSP